MLVSIKISRNSAFLGSDKLRMLFFLLINVKMPTTVGILTIMSRENFMRCWHFNNNEQGKFHALLAF